MTGVLILVLLTPWAAAAPAFLRVDAVEPPSWWAGHSVNPVRVLLSGGGLTGARVEAGEGLSAGPVMTSASGTYLFVDVTIDPKARPGRRALSVVGPGGRARAFFELLEPLPRAGRFQGFSPDDVIYLAMVDRFANGDSANDDPPAARGLFDRSRSRYYHGGDLRGMAARLPYLKDLGVTAVWLTPVYDNSNEAYPVPMWSTQPYTDYHGYGAVNLYAVDEHAGDVAELRKLADAAHALGMKLILDQVANHVGPRHRWAADPPTRTWFNGSVEKHLANGWQKWPLIDPRSSEDLRRPTLEGWFADVLPDLDQRDPEVARYLIQNSLWWVGVAGIDGIRQDTLPYVPRPFLRDWMAALKREYPDLRVVGEVLNLDPVQVAFFQGGARGHDGVDTGVDTLFDFPLKRALHGALLERKPMTEVAAALSRDALYPNPDLLVNPLGGHDEPRFMGRPGADRASLRLAFAFVLTTRGIPMLYYGDEIGMPGGDDPENRRDFPGGWAGDKRDAFTEAGRSAEERDVFDFVRRLARLRAGSAPLRRGRLIHLACGESSYAYARATADGAAVVVLNASDKPELLDLSLAGLPVPVGGELGDGLGGPAKAGVSGGRLRLSAPARSAAVFSW